MYNSLQQPCMQPLDCWRMTWCCRAPRPPRSRLPRSIGLSRDIGSAVDSVRPRAIRASVRVGDTRRACAVQCRDIGVFISRSQLGDKPRERRSAAPRIAPLTAARWAQGRSGGLFHRLRTASTRSHERQTGSAPRQSQRVPAQARARWWPRPRTAGPSCAACSTLKLWKR
jgi:hypothetical protein